jgi:oligopeptide/dipeptide ABC transporter ATP-binding protein
MIRVERLSKYFSLGGGLFSRRKVLRAVQDVSFRIERGWTLGLVGESGSGKTTVGRTLLRLQPPTSGRVLVDDKDFFGLSAAELRSYRKRMQIIFQDPFASLNPRMTVGHIIAEGMEIHRIGTSKERRRTVERLLETVGLESAAADRYPHEFRGGQRQRIAVARAVSLGPEFVVCDEPVSALDVSIQAQIVNLLMDLQKNQRLAYLFISHDLSVVRHISHEIAVMYAGRIVEFADRDGLFSSPRHPYTKTLLSAIPTLKPKTAGTARVVTPRTADEAVIPEQGCAFAPRCSYCMERCRREVPPEYEDGSGRRTACFLYA